MRFIGWNTIYGVDGEHQTPYMFRAWIWRLRLHIFYRGDADPDCHDHPWDFWTFPLTSYVEEVVDWKDMELIKFDRVVKAGRWHHRTASHTHRVLGRWAGDLPKDEGEATIHVIDARRIITIVWSGPEVRRWGFLKYRDGKWCWVHWKKYIFEGGKHTACE